MNYSEQQLKVIHAHLSDWRWRFANLYWINPADPNTPECLFKPRKEQWEILEAIYVRGETKLAILKARQLGFSTLLALICLDMVLFNAGFVCGLVDQTKEDAEKKMDKIKFAWERLPDDVRGVYQIVKENMNELTVRRPKKASSTVYCGKNARGGTHQLLWISEWGAIQFDDPKRSDEIADGALPSSDQGITIVETTWKGGRTGRLYTEVVELALKLSDEYRTSKDWKIYFFAWWLDERYTFDGDVEQITKDCREYFQELENSGVQLSDGQKLWYFKTAWVKRNKRYEEYPSLLAEIFLSPVEGAIYAKFMYEAETSGRIINYSLSKHPIYSFWDIGKSDLMSITIIQPEIRFTNVFDCYLGQGNPLKHYADWIKKWEREYDFFIDGHYLPWDGGWSRLGKEENKSFAEMLSECGLRNVQTVSRTPRVVTSIEQIRDKLPRMIFHNENLSRVYEFGTNRISFLDAMNNYRFAPLGVGQSSANPLHDINSHICDSLRTYSEADELGLIPKSGHVQHLTYGEIEAQHSDMNIGLSTWD